MSGNITESVQQARQGVLDEQALLDGLLVLDARDCYGAETSEDIGNCLVCPLYSWPFESQQKKLRSFTEDGTE